MDPVQLSPGALAAIPMEQMAKDPSISDATKVEEMARQFEAVLLRQILASARKPVIDDEEGETSSTDKLYDDMVNQQFAEAISRSGDFGLARSLSTELVRQTQAAVRSASGHDPISAPPATASRPDATLPDSRGAIDARAALTSLSNLR